MTAEALPGTGLFERAAAAFAECVPLNPADDGFFGPASVTWRLHADLSAPVAGLRSLLLQALHPLAMAGVDQHSHWRADPGARFASTAAYVLTTTYGDRAAARAAAASIGPGARRRSTTTISLPRPFILTKSRSASALTMKPGSKPVKNRHCEELI